MQTSSYRWNNTNLETEITMAPEGGWGWMVVVSVFLYFFIETGNFKALGVFVPRFEDQLNLDRGSLGTIGSLFIGISFLLGPLWTRLARITSPRRLGILSGVVTGIGFIGAAFSMSGITLALSMIIISLGLGMPHIAYMQILREYFDTTFALVSGIAFAGASLGIVVIPPLADFLIEIYGVQMSLVLLGAFSLNLCVGSTLLRPLIQSKSEPSRISYEPLNEYDEENDSEDHLPMESSITRLYSLYKLICQELGVHLMQKLPVLILYNIAYLIWAITFTTWVIFLVSFAIGLGYSAQNASFLSTTGGVGCFVGRVLFMLLVKWGITVNQTTYCILSVCSTLSFFLYPFVQAYWILAIVSFTAGLSLGTKPPVVTVMLKEVVSDDEHEFATAVGVLLMFLGIGALVGGHLTGSIYDVTGSFQMSFYTLAGLEFVAALLTSPWTTRWCESGWGAILDNE